MATQILGEWHFTEEGNSRQAQRVTCNKHHRWIYIQNADGTEAQRRCPECPRSQWPSFPRRTLKWGDSF